jgi:hypothetical protein
LSAASIRAGLHFAVAIVVVAWLRTLSLFLDDIQYTRHTVQTLYLFLTTRGYARFLLLTRSYVRSSIVDDAWLRTLSIVDRQHLFSGLVDCQHSLAGLVANVLLSLAGLSLCQHPSAGILVSVLSRLSLTLLVDFHRSIEKGSAIKKPYN